MNRLTLGNRLCKIWSLSSKQQITTRTSSDISNKDISPDFSYSSKKSTQSILTNLGVEPHPNGVNPETGEINGPGGQEPTRYGDWERKGRCIDF
ncbi:hypothetical protein GJ496_006612 [Pomphorhynchus laevis]|nr:hypothetical protein GJ496_006612 [Pomphorhynchus laevis]